MIEPKIPAGVPDVTAEWLTAALRAGGHDLTVVSARPEPIGTGQMGVTYRLRLSYEGRPGPPTMIIKLPSLDEAMRARVAAGYAAEVGVYHDLARGLDLRTPQCWHAAISEDRTNFVLLLDDLAPGRPGVQAEGCTPVEAAGAVANLVGLHAPTWNDRSLWERPYLMKADLAGADKAASILGPATAVFTDRYCDELTDAEGRTLREVAEAIGRWMLAEADPFALLHGDYRLDNLLFFPDEPIPAAVDWQTASVGPPLRDVAYFLSTCLESSVRRRMEEELVEAYHAGLVRAGIDGYEADRCWRDYRLGQLQAPMVTVIGCVYASAATRSASSDAMFLAMARRSCEAIRDLSSLALL